MVKCSDLELDIINYASDPGQAQRRQGEMSRLRLDFRDSFVEAPGTGTDVLVYVPVRIDDRDDKYL
jgi:hypothetical protein